MCPREEYNKKQRDKYARNRDKYLSQKRGYEKTYYERRAIITLKAKYSVTDAEATELFVRSMLYCDCCNDKWDSNLHKTRFHVDHDHNTGIVRGILCSSCNTSLGLLKESTQRMDQLIGYTERMCNK